MGNEIQPNISPVAPPPQVPVLPPKNWPKILLLVLAELAAIAASVFAGIQIGKRQIPAQTAVGPTALPATTNSSIIPTPNWKTYTNQEGRYTYSFPSDWKNTEPCHTCEGPQNSSTVNNPNSKYPDGYLTVSYYDSSYCLVEQKNFKSFNWKDRVEKQIILSGENGNLFQGTLPIIDDLQYTSRYILISHNNTCYVIASWSYQNPNQEKIFDQILSTFKFTN